eukprot:4892644-Lingulodinium_polyedra.AAC.1
MERATRAICDALRPRTVDSAAALRTVFKTVRNDAVESTARHPQIARLAYTIRTPCLVFARRARSVRYASRCNGGRSV